MKRKLTRSELATAIALACDLPRELAGRAVTTTFNSITCALADGEEVRIVGFGSFSTRRKSARSARNPRTGDNIAVPECRIVRFVPGGTLKEAVRKS